MTIRVAALVLAVSLSANAWADNNSKSYEVTITNITPGQTFTPILAATHKADIRYFTEGEPAIPELAELAESGNTAPLDSLLNSVPELVYATAGTAGLLGPGESATFTIDSRSGYDRLSFAGMLIPTNDSFVAANAIRLPRSAKSFTVMAYDAGSEHDDELCANIPGPTCGGQGLSDSDGEGFVHIGNGMHGIGDLDPAVYDWRNPVARVEVRRIR